MLIYLEQSMIIIQVLTNEGGRVYGQQHRFHCRKPLTLFYVNIEQCLFSLRKLIYAQIIMASSDIITCRLFYYLR